jgi:hypothetical protein
VALTTHPSSAEVKKRVELHLYFPLGLRGLFYGALYFTFTFASFPSINI